MSKTIRRVAKNRSVDIRVSRCEYKGKEFISVVEWCKIPGEPDWKPKRGWYVSVPLRAEVGRQLILGLAEALEDEEVIELIEPFCPESAPVA